MSDTFLDDILEKFGDEVLITDSSDIIPISTGSISLDASIGIGGIPRGRITEIFGSEGTGKTTMALGMTRYALSHGNKALYIDAENMLDYKLINMIVGEYIDAEKLVILNPQSAEDAFEMAEVGIKSGEFALVVLDSIGALAPQKEKDDDFAKANVALTARLVTKFLRRISYEVKNTNTALVLLNQVRDKIGSFIGGYDTPGGHALKHFTALRIALTRGKKIEVKKGKEKTVVGVEVNFNVRKNKLAPPFRGFHFPIMFGVGIDTPMDYLEYCTMLGIIKKSGAFYKFEGETLGQGKLAAAKTLSEDKLALDKMQEMVYNILEIKVNSEDIEEDVSE